MNPWNTKPGNSIRPDVVTAWSLCNQTQQRAQHFNSCGCWCDWLTSATEFILPFCTLPLLGKVCVFGWKASCIAEYVWLFPCGILPTLQVQSMPSTDIACQMAWRMESGVIPTIGLNCSWPAWGFITKIRLIKDFHRTSLLLWRRFGTHLLPTVAHSTYQPKT